MIAIIMSTLKSAQKIYFLIGLFLLVASCGRIKFEELPVITDASADTDVGGDTDTDVDGDTDTDTDADTDTDGDTDADTDTDGDIDTDTACQDVVCDSPPDDICASNTELTTYEDEGSCDDGECIYDAATIPCNTPPDDYCEDDTSVFVFDTAGTCDEIDNACTYGGNIVPCTDPPADICLDANTVIQFEATGSCDSGLCDYHPLTEPCTYGCLDGVCQSCTLDEHCDDGLWCNGAEICNASNECEAGIAPDCNDGVGCTVDTCNEGTDSCDNAADHGACDDGLWCNGTETCDAVSDCQAGTAPDCDDSISCTTDSCNEGLDSCDNVDNCVPGQFCEMTGCSLCDRDTSCGTACENCTQTPCTDCVADNRICKTDASACVECNDHADCSAGFRCNADLCEVDPSPTDVEFTSAPQSTAMRGNLTGGALYQDACPDEEVIIGFHGFTWTPDTEAMGQIQALCGEPSVSCIGTNCTVTIVPGTTLPLRGLNNDTNEWTQNCPPNEVVIGFGGRADALVDQLSFRCTPLEITYNAPGYSVSRGAVITDLPPAGGDGGMAFPDTDCPAGEVATIAEIRAGDAIDALGLGCQLPALVY